MFVKDKIFKNYYPFIIFGIIFFIAQCFIVLYPGDDTYFIDAVTQHKNIFDFVAMRYETWSGRIASEFFIAIFSMLNLWIWKIINTIFAVMFLILISHVIKITILKNYSNINKIVDYFVCLSFFIIPISVTTRSCSWFTGSFYYLWPTVFCLIGMLPYLYKLYNKELSGKLKILVIASVFYASYMEQTAAVLLCFGILTSIYLYIKNKEIDSFFIIENIIVSVNLFIYKLSPGNIQRIIKETNTWYPNFNELSFLDKVYQGINWTHSHLIRESTVIMLLISSLLFIIYINNNKHRKVYVEIIAFIPSLFFIGSMMPINKIISATTSYEYNFDVENILSKIFFNPMSSIISSSISALVMLSLIGFIFVTIKNKNDRYICLILYLASLSSGYILGLSPTIFASGPRIFFMSNILLIIISGILLKTMIEQIKLNELLWKITTYVYIALSSIYSIMYIGGIAIKTLFKID